MHVIIFLYFKSCKQENGYVSFQAFAIVQVIFYICWDAALCHWVVDIQYSETA